MKLFSIYDEKADSYSQPFTAAANGLAIRQLQELVNDKTTTISKYPEDFSLYFIGDFDSDRGLLLPLDTVPVLLIRAKDCITE